MKETITKNFTRNGFINTIVDTKQVRKMKKIYLATPISTEGEKKWSKKLAKKIRELGYEVYAAADNDSINDKSNNPTPRDIYVADIDQIKKADVVMCNITG